MSRSRPSVIATFVASYTDYEIDDCFGRASEAAGPRHSIRGQRGDVQDPEDRAIRGHRGRKLKCGTSSLVALRLSLRGAAAEQATRQGIATISLSLSQSGGTATAVVVAESTTGSSDR